MADDCHLGLVLRCAFDKRRGKCSKHLGWIIAIHTLQGKSPYHTKWEKEKSSTQKCLGRGCHVFPKFVYNDMIWYDMIWYDIIWYDMIGYDTIWYNIYIYTIYTWYMKYDMIWYDMIYLSIIIQKHVCFVIPPRIPEHQSSPNCLLICLHKEWPEGTQATPKWCTLWPWKFSV